jgi:hypothetical protein
LIDAAGSVATAIVPRALVWREAAAMSRLLQTPDRVYEVQRARVIRRLIMDQWFGEADAETWTAMWEREAEILGRDRLQLGYWDEGLRWIATKRS